MTTRLPDRHRSNALLVGTARFTSDAITDLPSRANNVTVLAEALTDPTTGIVDPGRWCQLINPRRRTRSVLRLTRPSTRPATP